MCTRKIRKVLFSRNISIECRAVLHDNIFDSTLKLYCQQSLYTSIPFSIYHATLHVLSTIHIHTLQRLVLVQYLLPSNRFIQIFFAFSLHVVSRSACFLPTLQQYFLLYKINSPIQQKYCFVHFLQIYAICTDVFLFHICILYSVHCMLYTQILIQIYFTILFSILFHIKKFVLKRAKAMKENGKNCKGRK